VHAHAHAQAHADLTLPRYPRFLSSLLPGTFPTLPTPNTNRPISESRLLCPVLASLAFARLRCFPNSIARYVDDFRDCPIPPTRKVEAFAPSTSSLPPPHRTHPIPTPTRSRLPRASSRPFTQARLSKPKPLAAVPVDCWTFQHSLLSTAGDPFSVWRSPLPTSSSSLISISNDLPAPPHIDIQLTLASRRQLRHV
jgi:hypothetical protein